MTIAKCISYLIENQHVASGYTSIDDKPIQVKRIQTKDCDCAHTETFSVTVHYSQMGHPVEEQISRSNNKENII